MSAKAIQNIHTFKWQCNLRGTYQASQPEGSEGVQRIRSAAPI